MNYWKEHKPSSVNFAYAKRWWQKKIRGEKFINLVEYETMNEIAYQIDIQIHRDDSVVKKTINVTAFTYRTKKPPFKQAEEDGRKIFALLTV